MEEIKVEHLTKDYGYGRGVFDVSFAVNKGEVFGFLGPNGAGKTTTIRHIMGFLKPDNGSVTIHKLDAYLDSEKTKKYIGYVPGEIAFPDLKTGTEFLKSQAEFLHLKNMDYANYLIDTMQLDPTANLKRMSKGMKQKTAIVAALMNDPEILLLDEPTTGLDPLMRLAFLKVIEEEKKKGKTILISSHLYEELEKVCDRVALIDKGRIVNITDMNDVKNRSVTDFKIEFNLKNDFEEFKELGYKIIRVQEKYNQITVSIEKDDIQKILKDLTKYDVKFMAEVKYSLEKHFSKLIKENKNDK